MRSPVTGRLADPPSQDIHLSIVCPRCQAPAGEGCRTPSGRDTTMHRVRWNRVRHCRRNLPMVYRLKGNDPEFGLTAGDLLLVENYPYDAKVSVLARIPDGYDPECNQYLGDVEFIRWATAEDLGANPSRKEN